MTTDTHSARRESIRADMEETRAEFHALLNTVSDEDWNRQSANPAWTVGELLYHMTVAARFLPEDVFLIRKARWIPRPPAFLFHGFNVLFARWGRRRATRQSVARLYDAVHARALRCLDSIQAGEWENGIVYPGWDSFLSGYVTIEKLFRYLAHHFQAHADEVRRALPHDGR